MQKIIIVRTTEKLFLINYKRKTMYNYISLINLIIFQQITFQQYCVYKLNRL